MTYGKYISNAHKNNISLTNAHDYLINEWSKGNISYPRTNGYNHPKLKIIKKDNINKGVEDLLLDFKIKKKDKINRDNIYFFTEQLFLSSPSSLISDVRKALSIKKRKFKDEFLKKYIYFFKNINKKDKYIDIDKINFKEIIKLETKKLKDKIKIFNNFFNK